MKSITIVFLLITVVFACQNNTSTSDQSDVASTEQSATDESGEQTASSVKVHNINFASKSELMTIPGISEEAIDDLIGERPYTSIEAVISALTNILGEDQIEAALQHVFLPLNLNTTPESTFKVIPGVGDKMAHEFEEYRPYTSIEQFRREIGKYVDDEEVARYEQYVFVPIDLNTASDDAILAIPGVGDRMLHEFKEYRPYTSMAQFKRELANMSMTMN